MRSCDNLFKKIIEFHKNVNTGDPEGVARKLFCEFSTLQLSTFTVWERLKIRECLFRWEYAVCPDTPHDHERLTKNIVKLINDAQCILETRKPLDMRAMPNEDALARFIASQRRHYFQA